MELAKPLALVLLISFIALSAAAANPPEKTDTQKQLDIEETWEPRHQWVDLNVGFGLYGLYGNAKLVKLRFDEIYWQLLRGTLVLQPTTEWGGFQLLAGTEVGVPIRLGPKTELLVGLGVEAGFSAECYVQHDCSSDGWFNLGALGKVRAPGLFLSPGVTLSRHVRDQFAFNIGLEANIFTGLYLDDEQMQAPYPIPNVSLFVGFTI